MINFLLLLAVIFWGLSFVATKMALQYLSPLEIIALRLLLGAPVLYLIVMAKKIDISFKKNDIAILLITSIVLAVHFLIQAFGLIYTSATNTGWLIATIPVFIAILSRLFLKEKVSPVKLLGILIATVGALFLISKGKLTTLDWLKSVGDWLILSSCVTWAIYTIITRDLTRRYHPLAVTLAILIIPALLLNAYCAYTTPISKLLELPLKIIGALVFLGVFCLGLAQWVWLEGLARKSATEVGVFLYIEPIVTTLGAIPILGESINLFGIVGALLILLGVYLVQRR
ncbi:MAG: DMT family transporter [Candidatus Zixiibacteriota bacterium]|jgi:drug/metabolite transporter (DMT)-like permease